jgi:hypothetical protein
VLLVKVNTAQISLSFKNELNAGMPWLGRILIMLFSRKLELLLPTSAK